MSKISKLQNKVERLKEKRYKADLKIKKIQKKLKKMDYNDIASYRTEMQEAFPGFDITVKWDEENKEFVAIEIRQ